MPRPREAKVSMPDIRHRTPPHRALHHGVPPHIGGNTGAVHSRLGQPTTSVQPRCGTSVQAVLSLSLRAHGLSRPNIGNECVAIWRTPETSVHPRCRTLVHPTINNLGADRGANLRLNDASEVRP